MPVTVLSALCTYPANCFYSRILVDALFQNGSSWIFRVFWNLILQLLASCHAYFSHLDKSLPRDTAKAHWMCHRCVSLCWDVDHPTPQSESSRSLHPSILCVIKVAFSMHAIMKKDGSTDPDHICVSFSQGEKWWSNLRKRTLSLGNVYQEFLIFLSEVGAKVSLTGE